jgi:hypothetical protein
MASSSVSSIPFEGLLLPLPLFGEEEACDIANTHQVFEPQHPQPSQTQKFDQPLMSKKPVEQRIENTSLFPK